MPPTSPSAAVLPQAWEEVLSRVQQALEQTEAATAEREKALAALPSAEPEPAAREAAWQEAHGRLRERLDALEACADRARQNAAWAEEAIAAGEEVVRRWRAACRAAAQKLAEGAAPPVG